MNNIPINFKGGGSIVDLKPQFSSNEECIYVAWKNLIIAYSTVTGKLLSEFKGISNKIVGFSVHFYDNHECVTACSETGEIIVWKTTNHIKFLTLKLMQNQITSFRVISSDANFTVLYSFPQKNQFYLATGDLNAKTWNTCLVRFPNESFTIDNSGTKYFSVIHDNVLFHIRFSEIRKFSKSFVKNRLLTSICCHPTEEMVLTGDNTGRIVLWQQIFSEKPIQSVFHWHCMPVPCMNFSKSGTFFYSGGDESVLVRWHLDNVYDRNYLPRLPAPIRQISVSTTNNKIAIATNDNAIKIINPQFSELCLIQHLVIGDHFDCGICVDPRTKTLVMNGSVGYIQFYSPNDKSLLYKLDVVTQNKITNEEGISAVNTQISQMDISQNGIWMSTVEERPDTEYSPELRLKFWMFNVKEQSYSLNTSIEHPHYKRISALSFQPITKDQNLKCVTVGEDSCFKVWQLTENPDSQIKPTSWICLVNGYYRNLACKGLAFTIDGSLLAVGFSDIVTAWIPDSCELKCSLIHPIVKERIQCLEFGRGDQSYLLVAASIKQMNVWNILTLSLVWTVPIQVEILISNPVTTHMAAITCDGNVVIFCPNDPTPLYISSKKVDKNRTKILAATFVPSKNSNDVYLKWYQRVHVYFIDNNRELYSLGVEDDVGQVDVTNDNVNDISLYGKLVPQLRTTGMDGTNSTEHKYANETSHLKQYLNSTICTLVPVRFHVAAILKSMVHKKSLTKMEE